MSQRKTYYQILHVQPDAPLEVIRSSYRTMMQKLKMHPDLGGNEENASIVNQAYSVLSNANSRAEYDASLKVTSSSVEKETPTTKNNANPSHNTVYNNFTIDTARTCAFCQSLHSLGDKIEPESLCKVCGSTLFPAVRQVLEKNGLRYISRIDKQWPVTFYIDWPDTESFTAQTQDVSLNGMQILSQVFLDEGQIIKIASQALDAVARVTNYREDFNEGSKLWRIGLEFITLRFINTQGTFIKLDV